MGERTKAVITTCTKCGRYIDLLDDWECTNCERINNERTILEANGGRPVRPGA